MHFICPAANATDVYKVDHRNQYPLGLTRVYSNFTPRTSRMSGIDHVINFGTQFFCLRYLEQFFDASFFKADKAQVVPQYQARVDGLLGPGKVTTEHLDALHDLGYLPLSVRALPEGTAVPLQTPVWTVENTDDRFGWLTNFVETLASCTCWGPMTSATIAFQYRLCFERYAALTGGNREMIRWQGHDFSMRGMYGLEAAAMSGAGHLTCFTGTDTIPAVDLVERYYGATGLIGGSVPATEHSVACSNAHNNSSASLDLWVIRTPEGRLLDFVAEGDPAAPRLTPETALALAARELPAGAVATAATSDDRLAFGEALTLVRLLTDVYPTGIMSYVSDSYDFWGLVTEILPLLRVPIVARQGKLVIRPDSGDPVKILTGDDDAPEGSPQHKGLVVCLYEIFGGTKNAQGFIELAPCIGAIYGDAITLLRQSQILERLAHKGFASTNVVLGIGLT